MAKSPIKQAPEGFTGPDYLTVGRLLIEGQEPEIFKIQSTLPQMIFCLLLLDMEHLHLHIREDS